MSGEVWRSDWSRRRARRQSDLCDPNAIKDDVHLVLRQLLERNVHCERPPQLLLELVASKRQSASLVEREGDAVILFDCAQSIALKRLFASVAADEPYDEAIKIAAAGAGLAVADLHPGLANSLFAIQIPADSRYAHCEAEIIEHYRHLKTVVLPTLLTDSGSSLIDGYLLAHEASHFVIQHPDGFLTRLSTGAKHAFAFALEQVCYEQQTNFKEIATHFGALTIDEDGFDRIRSDLTARRKRYEAVRSDIVEEIACDAYALVLLASSHASQWKTTDGTIDGALAGFLRMARSFFLIVALSDLHQAMIKRARLAVDAGGTAEKPDDIADMHFRKMALIFSMAELAISCLPEPMRSSEHFPPLLQWAVAEIGVTKQAFDALVVIPVTRVIDDFLAEQEGRQAAPADYNLAPIWEGRLQPLFGRGWPSATFDESTARRLIGS